MNLRYVTVSQISELTGCDRRTIKSRLSHIEPFKRDGRSIFYDANLILQLKSDESSDEEMSNQLRSETLRLEKEKADEKALKNSRTRGEQVAIEDVAKIVEREYSAVRSQLISIPIKMCLELSTIEDPAIIQNKLQDAINECLTELCADEKFINNEIPEIKGPSGELSIDSEIDDSEEELPKTKAKNKSSRMG